MRCGNSHFPCASQKSAASGTAEGSARHAKGRRAAGPGGLLAAWVLPASPAPGPAALPVRRSALGAAHGAGPCFPTACGPWRWAGGSGVPIATAARLGPFSFLFPEPGCWGRQRLKADERLSSVGLQGWDPRWGFGRHIDVCAFS